jgi:hypothetical protein
MTNNEGTVEVLRSLQDTSQAFIWKDWKKHEKPQWVKNGKRDVQEWIAKFQFPPPKKPHNVNYACFNIFLNVNLCRDPLL